MTFDDGIIKIYRLVNVSEKGDKPKYKTFYKSSFYFSYETLSHLLLLLHCLEY